MIAALNYEWRRITTLRSTWWLTGVSIGVASGFTFLICMILRLQASTDIHGELTGDDSRFYVDAAMTQFSNIDPMFYLLAYVVAIIGILSWGHEYRHGMIRATLTAVPQRWAVWTAKYVVVAAWVAAVVVITCVLSLLFTIIWFSGLEFEYDFGYMLLVIFKRIVFSVLLTWLVMSVTVLIRHQTFALVLLYLWPLGIENMLRLVLITFSGISGDRDAYEASRFLPFNAGGRIIQNWNGDTDGGHIDLQHNLDVFGDPLSVLGGLIVFGGLTVVLMGVSMLAFQKRDA